MIDRKPNWSKWKLIPNAMIWQVAALSLDIDPDKVEHHPQGWMAGGYNTMEGQEFKDRVSVIAANAMNDENSLLYLITLNQRGKEYCQINIVNFIKWATSKSLNIPPELSRVAKDELGNEVKPLFDKNSLTYPRELDYAIKAWQAVSNTESDEKPKARIKKWLDANTTFSDEAKERIAIVANWDKLGGAPRSS